MISKISNFFVVLVKKYLPSPYVIALMFTLLVFVLGIVFAGQTPTQMVDHWYGGFYSLLSFTMQMVMILFTGYAFANAPIVLKGLKTIARIPKNTGQAVIFLYAVTFVLCYTNWALGLIGGALIAKEIAKVRKGIHFPILVAVAYGANNTLLGLSSSIPLVIATEGHFLQDSIGIVPVSQSLFSSWNLIITSLVFITSMIVFRLMVPKKGDKIVEIDASVFEEEKYKVIKEKEKLTPAERIENSCILTFVIGGLGIIYLLRHFITNGFDLGLNVVILIFFTLGVIGHVTPYRYANAVKDAMKSCAGIALQFPIYAGIMGMMKASGLTAMMSSAFLSIATLKTFPVITFFSAGLINFLVPGGGAQWTVQGPIMVPAGATLGVDPAKVALALAWGDVWTNLVQPFWALPVLAVAGLKVKDIMGYCAVVAISMGAVITILFLLL